MLLNPPLEKVEPNRNPFPPFPPLEKVEPKVLLSIQKKN
jgi:hypothetical protein